MNKTGNIIRIVSIVLMGLTAAMNLLGGIGTSCVAFSSNVGFRMAFKELMDYRWLYQIFVVATILIGIVGIWATVKLVRGGQKVYRNALIVLSLGTLLAGAHYYVSLSLRGAAAPANVKFYLNVLTLLIFLALNIPGVREKVNFADPGGRNEANAAAGVAAITAGALALTVFQWAGPSHTVSQENWTYTFFWPLVIIGTALIVWGIGRIGRVIRVILAQEIKISELQTGEN